MLPANVFYIGLLIMETIDTMNKYILTTVNEIKKSNHETETDILELVNGIKLDSAKSGQGWRYPELDNTWHVTTLWDPNNNKDQPAYDAFVNGKPFNILIKGAVYVPGKIMFSIVFADTPTRNKFMHSTVMINSLERKYSNNVAEALFDEGRPLHEMYLKMASGQYVKEGVYKERIKLNIDDGEKLIGTEEEIDAYFVKFKTPYVFKSRMHMFFTP